MKGKSQQHGPGCGAASIISRSMELKCDTFIGYQLNNNIGGKTTVTYNFTGYCIFLSCNIYVESEYPESQLKKSNKSHNKQFTAQNNTKTLK